MGWKERFDKFDRDNPHVYDLFKRFTFEMIKAGHPVLSSKLIVERIRWETMITTKTDEDYRINDAFTAYYSRKFTDEFPHLTGTFRTRVLRRA